MLQRYFIFCLDSFFNGKGGLLASRDESIAEVVAFGKVNSSLKDFA